MDNPFSAVIIESMSDGVLVIDFQGRIVHVNPAGLDILGLNAPDIIDRTYAELFMGTPENDAFNDILIQGLQDRETRLYREVPFMREDGRLLELGVTTSFLRLEPGKWDVPGIVVVYKDITEFKALNRARQRVIDHLSHELKTPISIVAASVGSLATPTNQKILDRIQRNLNRLKNIQAEVEDIVRTKGPEAEVNPRSCVDETLDLLHVLAQNNPAQVHALKTVEGIISSHFPHRNAELHMVRIRPILERVRVLVEELSPRRHVRLEVEISGDPCALTVADIVEKALMSLVKNAVENTPDGGTVTLSLGTSSEGVELMVRDTGVGITEESREQIFGGFYHARETDFYSTKRPFDFDAGGKGLELLKLRVFAEVYHFTVTCVSTRCTYLSGEDATCPGVISECPHVQDTASCAAAGGATFTLVFPLAQGV